MKQYSFWEILRFKSFYRFMNQDVELYPVSPKLVENKFC